MKKKTKKHFFIITAIMVVTSLAITNVFADEEIDCTRTMTPDWGVEEYNGWCWDIDGGYLGVTNECPSGDGNCDNYDCEGTECDWIPNYIPEG